MWRKQCSLCMQGCQAIVPSPAVLCRAQLAMFPIQEVIPLDDVQSHVVQINIGGITKCTLTHSKLYVLRQGLYSICMQGLTYFGLSIAASGLSLAALVYTSFHSPCVVLVHILKTSLPVFLASAVTKVGYDHCRQVPVIICS